MSKQAMTLEEALTRLEEISEAMDGKITIDESLTLYGEAVKLIDFANAKLNTAKQKVEKLMAKPEETEDGTI